jgi:uncharacterized membrane protein
MAGYDLKGNGFMMFTVAVGFALVLISLINGAAMAISISRGVALRTFTGTRNYVVGIVSDFVLPLVGGVCLILAGVRIFRYERRRVYRDIKSGTRKTARVQKTRVMASLLSPDERKVLELVTDMKGEALQSSIVIKSGYSKVKVHRLLKSLENKGVIKRGRFGITNKVMLNK